MIHLLFLLMFVSPGDADWKTLSDDARSLSEQGYHADAAKSYEKAWLSNETETDLLVSAGTEYLQARLYADASRVLSEAMLDGNQSQYIHYKLGLALKGAGQYKNAIAMLSESIPEGTEGGYLLGKVIESEIEGCEMALMPDFASPTTDIRKFNNEINSSASEYAPMHIGNNKLIFASSKSGSVKVYESINNNNQWSRPGISQELSSLITGNYGGGTFNRDRSEFYYSLCDASPSSGPTGQNCKIYKSQKTTRGWSRPKVMRDYINWAGATTSHPTIVYEGDTEVLYFTSNREGGQGGMDIWYATREVSSTDIDFTFPVNAGPLVNSMRDEVTPYYDRSEGSLYFSSNGHRNAGGLDVFKVSGKRNQWTRPENLGNPVNSSADDYYFSTKLGTDMAYLTSNRTSGNDDIYEINFKAQGQILASTPVTSTGTVTHSPSNNTSTRNSTTGSATHRPTNSSTRSSSVAASSGAFQIKGRITDPTNGQVLTDAYVTLYRAVGETKRRKIETIKPQDGRYTFNMPSGAYYIVEAYKPGYKIGDFEFNTEELDSGVSIDIPLDRTAAYASTTRPASRPPVATTQTTRTQNTYTPPPSTRVTPTRPPVRTEPTYTNVVTTPTRTSNIETYTAGTEYRIQLTAVRKYNPMLPIFANARKYGTLGTEIHPNGQLTRVFLRSFNSYAQAKTLIDTMKGYGFDTAFVVKYQDGTRVAL